MFAVNAPVLNNLFKSETWKTRHSSGGFASKNWHPSQTNNTFSSAFSTKKKGDFEIYKMTNTETSSKESTSELVREQQDAAVPSEWRFSFRLPSEDAQRPGFHMV
jgi:hypothetical protein